MKSNNTSVKITVATISVFIITISILAWYSNIRQDIYLDETKVLIEIGEVTVPVLSQINGTYHDVTVEFYLQVEARDEKSLDMSQVETDIIDIMEGLNYDNITTSGNINYIKNNILTELNSKSNIEISNVYISNINSGSYNIIS